MDLLQDILQSPEMEALVNLIIKAIFATVGLYLTNFINKKTSETIASTSKEQVVTIKNIALMAVRFVQQTMKETGNDIKLQEAMNTARKELDSRNIKVGNKPLMEYIEEAVSIVKQELETGIIDVENYPENFINAPTGMITEEDQFNETHKGDA